MKFRLRIFNCRFSKRNDALRAMDSASIRNPQSAIRTGFTLVEVMFAVITLGIGLIMLAAIFPVAIQQRKLTGEESNAAAIATQAMNILNQMNSYADLPPTSSAYYNTGAKDSLGNSIFAAYPGVVRSFRDPQTTGAIGTNAYPDVRGNLILPSDSRVAWIPLYRRDGILTPNDVTLGTSTYTYASSAQVIMVAVQCRNFSTFVTNDHSPTTSTNIANLQALPVKVTIANNDPAVDTVQLAQSGATDYTPAAVQSAYIVIANDSPAKSGEQTPHSSISRCNAHIYKLGLARPDLGAGFFELAPGGDFDSEPALSVSMPAVTSLTNVDAFLIGAGMTDPNTPASGYSGPAMPIAVYTGFVAIH